MLTVKVLGPGCSNCQKLEKLARVAAAGLGVEAQIEHLTDRADFKRYNLLATPGLVINERLVSAGRLPSVAEISTWLADATMAAETP
jgi:small redox-active disulfide protein 2